MPGTFLYWPNPQDVVGSVTPVASEVISLLLVRILHLLILNPKYWVSSLKNSHFDGFNLRLCLFKLSNTFWMCLRWFSTVSEKKKNIVQVCQSIIFLALQHYGHKLWEDRGRIHDPKWHNIKMKKPPMRNKCDFFLILIV